MKQHSSEQINDALVKLCDALCAWERNTGVESVLILRENNFNFRAVSGKPINDNLIADSEILNMVMVAPPYNAEAAEQNTTANI